MRRLGFAVTTVALSACATQARMNKADQEGMHLRAELAATYVSKGAYEAAIPLLQRSLAETPKDPSLHTLYATVLRERGLYPQAEHEYRVAIQLAPDQAAAYDGLGILDDLRHQAADAEQNHRKAVELAPTAAMFWNNLGFSLYAAGRYQDAIAPLEKALALDPSLAVALDNLGFAYGRTGDYDDAERCFKNAGGEGPGLANLALVYEENGDAATAAKLRADAIAADPSLADSLTVHAAPDEATP